LPLDYKAEEKGASPDVKTAVAFLIFNRRETTAQVFAAIRAAQPSKLLVVADGPRPGRPGEEQECKATRAVIEQVDWPCEVQTNYAKVNLGCRQRVSSGLDWVFSQIEEAIILEDDCLPHPSFFRFCEHLLERYREDERVMMIGGTNYLHNRLKVEESYVFSRYFSIWGWASWRRAWSRYDITMKEWPRLKKQEQLKAFYAQPYMRRFVTSTFDATYRERINTWDVQWFYSCLFNNGLSIIPRVNLVSNIGTLGAHSAGRSINNFFPVFPLDTEHMRHPDLVHPDVGYDDRFFSEQFKPRFAGLLRRGKAFVRKRGRRVLNALTGRTLR